MSSSRLPDVQEARVTGVGGWCGVMAKRSVSAAVVRVQGLRRSGSAGPHGRSVPRGRARQEAIRNSREWS